jgi:hypothetical protein
MWDMAERIMTTGIPDPIPDPTTAATVRTTMSSWAAATMADTIFTGTPSGTEAAIVEEVSTLHSAEAGVGAVAGDAGRNTIF